MPAAARLGDLTSHASTPLGPGPGSSNVLIGSQPAWRALCDSHLCPLSTPNPHGVGVVLMGSTTVYINSFPAVRQGDQVIEAGPPNAILMGMPTVIIGG
jgi:uncharacterized Zn-binding protein involved in type VI secretion